MTIASNLEAIEKRIQAACERAGRDRNSVTLVGVSKRKPASDIEEALDTTSLRDFGENYVQEYLEKREKLAHRNATWHLIGHLQRNKVRALLAYPPDLIHSVDSLALADHLERVMTELYPEKRQPILVELRIGDEDGEKTGLPLEEFDAMMAHLQTLTHLDCRGLMLIPPVCEDPEASRPYFRQVRSQFEALNRSTTHPMTVLSYGMSHDFEVAIEEGATHIRVGTAIFGARS